MIDKDYKLWLTEIKESPALNWAGSFDDDYYKKLLRDTFEIVLSMRKKRL